MFWTNRRAVHDRMKMPTVYRNGRLWSGSRSARTASHTLSSGGAAGISYVPRNATNRPTAATAPQTTALRRNPLSPPPPRSTRTGWSEMATSEATRLNAKRYWFSRVRSS